MIIKPCKGFTSVLFRWARDHPSKSFTAFLNGPYGNPPRLTGYDTIVLIATGNRASFVLSLLQELTSATSDVPQIYVHLIARTLTEINWYLARISASFKSIPLHRTEIEVQLHLTCTDPNDTSIISSLKEREMSPTEGVRAEPSHSFDDSGDDEHDEENHHGFRMTKFERGTHPAKLDSRTTPYSGEGSSTAVSSAQNTEKFLPAAQGPTAAEVDENNDEKHLLDDALLDSDPYSLPYAQFSRGRSVRFSFQRPTADTMISTPVTEARGRTLVVAAVASSLNSQIATCVARLNQEIITPWLNGNDHLAAGPTSLELWTEFNSE